MIRSEISHSPAPLPMKNLEKKPDFQDDFNLLLQMFTQPLAVVSGFEESLPTTGVESKALLPVETAEAFSRMFAQQLEKKSTTPTDTNNEIETEWANSAQVIEPLSGIKEKKSSLSSDSLRAGLTLVADKAIKTESTSNMHMFTTDENGIQQVVEWGSLSNGYLSYLSPAMLAVVPEQAVLSGMSAPVLAKTITMGLGTTIINRAAMQSWPTRLEPLVAQVVEDSSAEIDFLSDTFDIDNSAATHRMATLWHAAEISREYLQLSHDERGGYRFYYRNYFAMDNSHASNMVFNLLGNNLYANLSEVLVNGQKVQQGDRHGR